MRLLCQASRADVGGFCARLRVRMYAVLCQASGADVCGFFVPG